jgi:hypothetical protein
MLKSNITRSGFRVTVFSTAARPSSASPQTFQPFPSIRFRSARLEAAESSAISRRGIEHLQLQKVAVGQRGSGPLRHLAGIAHLSSSANNGLQLARISPATPSAVLGGFAFLTSRPSRLKYATSRGKRSIPYKRYYGIVNCQTQPPILLQARSHLAAVASGV